MFSQGQEPASNENLKIYDPDPDRIFSLLRTGHYLSPAWGGGGDLGEVSLKTLEESRGRTTQISLENEDMSDMWGQTGGGGGGGSRKSSKVIRRDYVSEVTLKGGSAKFHLV